MLNELNSQNVFLVFVVNCVAMPIKFRLILESLLGRSSISREDEIK
jgi:hypothetical protein